VEYCADVDLVPERSAGASLKDDFCGAESDTLGWIGVPASSALPA
jgi:hypothetical protein